MVDFRENQRNAVKVKLFTLHSFVYAEPKLVETKLIPNDSGQSIKLAKFRVTRKFFESSSTSFHLPIWF